VTTSRRLRLRLVPGTFVVCRLGPDQAVPAGILESRLVSVTRTPHELSIVCAAELAPPGVPCEGGWKALAVQGPLPFTATGILASLAVPLAAVGVSIFAISTFDTDYLLVQEAQLGQAMAALQGSGHEVER